MTDSVFRFHRTWRISLDIEESIIFLKTLIFTRVNLSWGTVDRGENPAV